MWSLCNLLPRQSSGYSGPTSTAACTPLSDSILILLIPTHIMPPKRAHDDSQSASLKDKLQHLQNSNSNARGRRNGGANALNGSNLKEVDNASSNSGQTSNDSSSSHVRLASSFVPFCLSAFADMMLAVADQMAITGLICPPELPTCLPP